MAKINPEVLRAASGLLAAAAAEQVKFADQCHTFEELTAKGLELAATGATDGHWFGAFVDACEEVLGEREPALAFGRLLGYHTKGTVG